MFIGLFSVKMGHAIGAMSSVFLPPLQGSHLWGGVPRIALRSTLGYDPAPLRGFSGPTAQRPYGSKAQRLEGPQ